MSDLRDDKLDFWIEKGYNVLFVGKHGVGKTAMITNAFNRAGLKWKYFSASTMDPFVDFVGVPKEKTENGLHYLDLVRPKEFATDEVEALFFDEFNRSHKKVRNAVMELIQFKSINGKKFNNLKIVWAAVNPDDEEDTYDVEKLDPAQLDRFHVQIEVPYKPTNSYFVAKYGDDMAQAGIAWWNELPADIKKDVSPRRLDYALDMYVKQGDLRDVLPAKANIGKLQLTLRAGPIKKILAKYVDENDIQGASDFINQENNYAAALNYLVKKSKFTDFFIPLLSPEKIAALLVEHKPIKKLVVEKMQENPKFQKVINDIVSANQNKVLVRELKALMPAPVKMKHLAQTWEARLDVIQQALTSRRGTTQFRYKMYQELIADFPEKVEFLSPQAATKFCVCINQIMGNTQKYTALRRYPKIGDYLSKAFSRLMAESVATGNPKSIYEICAAQMWAELWNKLGTNFNATPAAKPFVAPVEIPVMPVIKPLVGAVAVKRA